MKHFLMHSLRDNEGIDNPGGEFQPTPGDRGDEVVDKKPAPPNDEEKKLAEEVKTEKKADPPKAEDDKEEKEEKKDTRIPLARHKALLESERAEKDKLIARLAQYERGEDLAKTNEDIKEREDKIIELEGEYTKLITDGKPDEAAKVMRQIRTLDREVGHMQTKLASDAAESRAYERARYDTTVERIEEAFPQMAPKVDDNGNENPDHDPAKIRKVLAVARAYQIDGYTPSKALQEAVKDILGEPKTKKQEVATEVTPRVDEAAVAKAKREEAARQKAAEASNRQPPNAKDIGKDADKLGGDGNLSAADVLKMPYADFSKLDEKTLARLRGDEVAP